MRLDLDSLAMHCIKKGRDKGRLGLVAEAARIVASLKPLRTTVIFNINVEGSRQTSESEGSF
jgi:hypothetical protein